MQLITVIGRGHGGTRAMSHTLYASGVYMGYTLNKSGDLLPAEDMYEACRVFGRYVVHRGGLDWDFSRVLSGPVDPAFTRLLEAFLRSVIDERAAEKGWKIPETTLVYPWIVRSFPDARYILWSRDPRDAILGGHLTDNLADFGVPSEMTDDVFRRRAMSWYYQWSLIKATPRPAKALEVRFEDFVLKQEETLKRLEAFLGIPLARIIVRPDSVGRWKTSPDHKDFDFLAVPRRELGYA